MRKQYFGCVCMTVGLVMSGDALSAPGWVEITDADFHEENVDKITWSHQENEAGNQALDYDYSNNGSLTDNKESTSGGAKWAEGEAKQYRTEDPVGHYGYGPQRTEYTFLNGFCQNVSKEGWHLGNAYARVRDPKEGLLFIDGFTNYNSNDASDRSFSSDPTGSCSWKKVFQYQDGGEICTTDIPNKTFYTHVKLEVNYINNGNADNNSATGATATASSGFTSVCHASPKDIPNGASFNNRSMSGSVHISRTESVNWSITGGIGWDETNGANVGLSFTVSDSTNDDWWNETGPTGAEEKHREWFGTITNEIASGGNSAEVSLRLTWLCEASATTTEDAISAEAKWRLDIHKFELSETSF